MDKRLTLIALVCLISTIWIGKSLLVNAQAQEDLFVLRVFSSRSVYATSVPTVMDGYWEYLAASGGLKDNKFLNATVIFNGEPVTGASITFEIYGPDSLTTEVDYDTAYTTDADPGTAGFQMEEWGKYVGAPGHYGAMFHWTTIPGDGEVFRAWVKASVTIDGTPYEEEVWVSFMTRPIDCTIKHGTGKDADAFVPFHIGHAKSAEAACIGCHQFALSGTHVTKAGFTCSVPAEAWGKGDEYCHGVVSGQAHPRIHYPSCAMDPTGETDLVSTHCHAGLENHTLFSPIYTRLIGDEYIDHPQQPCYICHHEVHNATSTVEEFPEVPTCDHCHPITLVLTRYALPYVPLTGIFLSLTREKRR